MHGRAFKELCGACPGYDEEPGPRASYQRDLISLPAVAAEVEGSSCLRGDAHRLWVDWEKAQLLPPEQRQTDGLPARPYSDPLLVNNKAEYAHFVAQLLRSGMCRITGLRPGTVGVFFVAKKNGMLRIIFDTRITNSRCAELSYTQLP